MGGTRFAEVALVAGVDVGRIGFAASSFPVEKCTLVDATVRSLSSSSLQAAVATSAVRDDAGSSAKRSRRSEALQKEDEESKGVPCEVDASFFAKVKWVADAPRPSVRAVLQEARRRHSAFMQLCQSEASRKTPSPHPREAAGAGAELRRRMELSRLFLDERNADSEEKTHYRLSLKDASELTALLIRQTAKIEALREELERRASEESSEASDARSLQLRLGSEWKVWSNSLVLSCPSTSPMKSVSSPPLLAL